MAGPPRALARSPAPAPQSIRVAHRLHRERRPIESVPRRILGWTEESWLLVSSGQSGGSRAASTFGRCGRCGMMEKVGNPSHGLGVPVARFIEHNGTATLV